MSGTLFSDPRLRAVNFAGDPLPGARLYWYQAGTSLLADTYTTTTLAVAHANPQIADASGWFRAVYLDPAVGHNYKAVMQNASGVQIWAEDNIPPGFTVVGDLPGPAGGDGMSVAELVIYQRTDGTPSTPTGGSFSFASQTLTPPSGWEISIPTGTAPVWVSTAVAAVDGSTGTDDVLAWSVPVKALSDGSSVDIVFKRYASQPPTPAPSPSTPATWYTDVDSVPVTSDKLWSSVGTRAHAGENWIWQLPIQVEGDIGPPGTDATMYYIKALSGTAIKNGGGTLTVEAHQLFGGNDVLLSAGSVKLYVGSTVVTEANGYATGSTGYIGKFDSGDISGSTVVELKSAPAGTVLDSITLVDVIDGATGGPGVDGVYGYIDASGGLAWTRDSDGTTWNPAATTSRLDCTFVQGGADVARVAWLVTRDADGLLTGATTTHGGGDLNSGRVTVTEANEGTQAFTVKFRYDYTGDVSVVGETLLTSMAGVGADGGAGPTGPGSITLAVSAIHLPVMAYQNGGTASTLPIGGQATVYDGVTDVTAAATALTAVGVGCTGTINTAVDTPVNGKPKGWYQITAVSADTGTLTLSATSGAVTATTVVSVSRNYVGYQIVTTLPNTNLFTGRMVYLTTDQKLYRYTGSAWTRAVDGADIVAGSVTTDALFAARIITAKIGVTQLDVLSANAGTITAGILQSSGGGARFDLTNARILFNTAPGTTGGFVRVQGYGFGPTNQYLDWYGPKPAGQSTDSGIIANLSDATAIYFLKIDGSGMSGMRARGEFEPKAWGLFAGTVNGNNAAQTILDRFNVASITRDGSTQGVYRVNFQTAVANANYIVVSNAASTTTLNPNPLVTSSYGQTTTYFMIRSENFGYSSRDSARFAFFVYGSNVIGGSNVITPTGGWDGFTRGFGNIP